jgi:hypothetical protein
MVPKAILHFGFGYGYASGVPNAFMNYDTKNKYGMIFKLK